MKVKKYKSNKEISININKYKINWQKSQSKGQQILQDFLYPYWKDSLILQEMRVPGTLWRFDLVNCNKKLIIEYSPVHHREYTPFFHKHRLGYLKVIQSDIKKEQWAETNNFKLIEVQEEDLDLLSYQFFIDKFDIYL